MANAYNKNLLDNKIRTDVRDIENKRGFVSIYSASPLAPSTTSLATGLVLDAVEESELEVTSQPDVPRTIQVDVSATTPADIAGGTTIDVDGIDIFGNEVFESFTLTEDTPETFESVNVFKEIIGIFAGAQDGASVTIDVGVGSKLALPDELALNTVLMASFNGVRETVEPTVDVSTSSFTLNSVLDGSEVEVYYIAK